MPKYVTDQGVVVERDEEYVKAFPEGAFVPVRDDRPVSIQGCCGDDEWQVEATPATGRTSTRKKKEK